VWPYNLLQRPFTLISTLSSKIDIKLDFPMASFFGLRNVNTILHIIKPIGYLCGVTQS
jgi:hypothetical protein